jgi:uncharacterized protein DUF1592/uncharacterized protein DUF1588/uncharacterized protein DUF1587/uncharacterized protein DUF1595/uncharacterized protein DUF1585
MISMAFRKTTLCLILLLTLCGQPALAQQTSSLEEGFFSKKLYPILEKANCRGCHVENGIAGTTRLHFPPESAPPQHVEAFGRSLKVLVDKERPSDSLLLKKPTQRIEHTGGKLISPGSEEERVLITWLNYLAALSDVPAETISKSGGTPLPALMRRLTHSQYNNTVRDLLSDQTRPADQFPQEDFVGGFKNQADAQTIPPLLAEAYSAAAERLAQNAYRSGVLVRLLPCPSSSTIRPNCTEKFVRHFGLNAFRRPLMESEVNQYANLFEKERRRTSESLQAARLVVEIMLQSPNFLFRTEHGPKGAWKSYQTASRLSYFLWDTMPDTQLFQNAAAGGLSTAEGIEQTTRRMLLDPRAHQALDEFVSQWLRFDRVLNTYRDRRRYPQFNPELAAAMVEESKRFIANLVWGNHNFMELFTADYSFPNSELAVLYGLTTPAEDFTMVKLQPVSDRAGILGQASFLTLTSKPADTSPTARGLFIREQFLCQKVPNPPPGTNMNLAPPAESKPQTTRERLSVHLANESCARCHSLIDPIGFGFEKFDAIGKERQKESILFFPSKYDRETKPKIVELEIDASGFVSGVPNSQFSSPKELGAQLAARTECQSCIAKQLFRYAMGRPEASEDAPVLEAMEWAFRNSQFRFKELMTSLVKSKVFQE